VPPRQMSPAGVAVTIPMRIAVQPSHSGSRAPPCRHRLGAAAMLEGLSPTERYGLIAVEMA